MRFSAIAFLVLIGTTSHAALQPVLLETPTTGQHVLSVVPSYSKHSNELNQANGDWTSDDDTTIGLEAKYSYGLNDDNALFAALLFNSNSNEHQDYVNGGGGITSSSSSPSGIRHIELGYEGKMALETVHLAYGAAYSTPIEESKADNVADTQSFLELSGGLFYQTESTGILGLTMEYANGLDKTINGTEYSGNNHLATTLFYEFSGDYRPQIALIHHAAYTAKIETSTTESSTAGHTTYGPRFAMRFHAGESTEITPALTYLMLDHKDVGTASYKTYDTYTLAVDCRFGF